MFKAGKPFGLDVGGAKRPTIPPPEANQWWWHPGRPGVRGGPVWFTAKLEEVDPDLAITWNAYEEQWQIWTRRPSMQHKVCWGWNYLFPVKGRLDERVFHRLYSASARRWGSAKAYFDAVEAEMTRERELREAKNLDDRRHEAADAYRTFLEPHVYVPGGS